MQFTKLSMHINVAPAMAAGRRRAEQQWQAEPAAVWEAEIDLSEQQQDDVLESNTGERGEERARRWAGAWLGDD